MLALSDGALTRIVIGATRIPRRDRGAWLQRIAGELERAVREPSASARRQRAWRSRQHNGEILLTVAVNRDDIIAALMAVAALDPANVTDANIADALARQVRDWAAAWGERAGV